MLATSPFQADYHFLENKLTLLCTSDSLHLYFLCCVCVCVCVSHSVRSDSTTPRTVGHQASLSMALFLARILEWVAIQGIFVIQGSNPSLLDYRQILYNLSHQGSPTLCISQKCFGWNNSISIEILKQKDFFPLNLNKEARDTARFGSTFDLRCLGATSSEVSLHLLALPSSERMSSSGFSKGGQQQ